MPPGPLSSAGFTCVTSVKFAVNTPNDACVQSTVPPAPIAGVVQIHPSGAVSDWKFTFTASGICRCGFGAASGPAFVIAIVYVMFCPATTGSGASLAVTLRSASGVTYAVCATAVLLLPFGSERVLVVVNVCEIV